MKTYRISEKDIQGLPLLATGYKVFTHDWTAKQNGYDYKDEKGNVVGTIHKVDGDIKECQWGLHFGKQPQDCFNFYECVQWNKFAKVEAYGECIDAKDGKKSISKILKIVKTYTFGEFINLIQAVLSGSRGVNYSDGVNCSYGVNESHGVNCSDGVNCSRGVNDSRGVNYSRGVNDSYGVTKCEGISRSLFCFETSGKLLLFNSPVSETRYEEVFCKLRLFDWYPRFNNAKELKGNLGWYETNIPAIVNVPNEIAWSFMP